MGEPAVLNEAEAIRSLAKEKWRKQGDRVISWDSYSPEAVAQIQTALTQETRDTLKFRDEQDRTGGAGPDAKKLVMSARAANALFATHGLKFSPIEQGTESQAR